MSDEYWIVEYSRDGGVNWLPVREYPRLRSLNEAVSFRDRLATVPEETFRIVHMEAVYKRTVVDEVDEDGELRERIYRASKHLAAYCMNPAHVEQFSENLTSRVLKAIKETKG